MSTCVDIFAEYGASTTKGSVIDSDAQNINLFSLFFFLVATVSSCRMYFLIICAQGIKEYIRFALLLVFINTTENTVVDLIVLNKNLY